VTFAIVVACSLAVGTAGYSMFGDTVADQVTLSLAQHSQATTAMTALTWLMVLTGSFCLVYVLLRPCSVAHIY
jgi:Transmembrane amino acid transporter protein